MRKKTTSNNNNVILHVHDKIIFIICKNMICGLIHVLSVFQKGKFQKAGNMNTRE